MPDIDAKAVCMIDDLSRYALFELLDYPAFTTDSTEYLRGQALARLGNGRLTTADVADAWEADDKEPRTGAGSLD